MKSVKLPKKGEGGRTIGYSLSQNSILDSNAFKHLTLIW